MVFLDVENSASGAFTGLTRYGLGGRGIDVVSTTTSSGNTVSYPLYDAHGNNVGLLGKNGSSFTVSNEKSYDAWGGLRSGTNANGKLAYCANLGHKQDDESGLIYMRARYYEPTSGRFVSEDRARDGLHWFAYASNDPISSVDYSGNEASATASFFIGFLVGIIVNIGFGSDIALATVNSLVCSIIGVIAIKGWASFTETKAGKALCQGWGWCKKKFALMFSNQKKLPPGGGGAAVFLIAYSAYAGLCASELFLMEFE
jgi:RHS repeat-associated protein